MSRQEESDSGREGKRASHPFHMYGAIRRQPDAFRSVVEHSAEPAERFADEAADKRKLYLVGTGTSFHAAQIGTYLVRDHGDELRAQAMPSFDFALYGPELTAADAVVVISHRGTKRYSRKALAVAREAGCTTALVTGKGNDFEGHGGDVLFRTVEQETSAAHTVSFVGAVAALSVLTRRLDRDEPRRQHPDAPPLLRERVPAALRAAIGAEDRIADWAREHASRRRIWLAGGGPSATMAREIALKIKETSYLRAEGMATEAMLHGPLQCTGTKDLFVLVAPDGPAQERTAELARAITLLGAPCVVVGNETSEELVERATGLITLPSIPEPLSALACGVALQLFAYHLALERETDPDGFRLEDPRFSRAFETVDL